MAKNLQSLPNLFYMLFGPSLTKLNQEGLLYSNCLPAINVNSQSDPTALDYKQLRMTRHTFPSNVYRSNVIQVLYYTTHAQSTLVTFTLHLARTYATIGLRRHNSSETQDCTAIDFPDPLPVQEGDRLAVHVQNRCRNNISYS